MSLLFQQFYGMISSDVSAVETLHTSRIILIISGFCICKLTHLPNLFVTLKSVLMGIHRYAWGRELFELLHSHGLSNIGQSSGFLFQPHLEMPRGWGRVGGGRQCRSQLMGLESQHWHLLVWRPQASHWTLRGFSFVKQRK